MIKNVSVVGTVGLPACYGGFESLVENLVRYKSKKIHYHVYCSKQSYKVRPKQVDGAELTYIPLKANGITSVVYDMLSMLHCIIFKKPDVILILGVSGCIFLPFLKLFSNSKIITNIDGLEWRRDKWGMFAKMFLKLSESISIKFSDEIVADNKAIGNYISSEYNRDNNIIAYGGDHAVKVSSNIECKSDGEYYLSLCRVEPENNVEMILSAFSGITEKLIFIGNWNNSEYGIRLKNKYSSYENITLLQPVYETDRLYTYRRGCRGYIHGHSAGGTNPSLVEMMHFGVTIYAYDCEFNRYSTENDAEYFDNESALVNSITKRYAKSNGSRMIQIAKKKYTWEKIIGEYERLY